MKEKPASLENALTLAQTQEAVETAQKRLQGVRGHHAAAATMPLSSAGSELEANTLQSRGRYPATAAKPQDLSQQIQLLTEAVTRLSTRVYGGENGSSPRSRRRRQAGPPVCWGCGETGHIRRNCPRNASREQENAKETVKSKSKGTLSLATDTALSVDGRIEQRPTRMLVDTGSAVTIVREDAWQEALQEQQPLEQVNYPVVAANGQQLELCGTGTAVVYVGGIVSTMY